MTSVNQDAPEADSMIIASVEELKIALRLYNEPFQERGMEGCLVHLNQAWTYLAHAAMRLNNQEIRMKLIEEESLTPWDKAGTRHKDLVSCGLIKGNPEVFTNDFSRIRYFTRFLKYPRQLDIVPVIDNSTNRTRTKLPAQLNLALIKDIRNRIEHRAVISREVFMHCMAPFVMANIGNYIFTLEEIIYDCEPYKGSVWNTPKEINDFCIRLKSEIRIPIFYDSIFVDQFSRSNRSHESYLKVFSKQDKGIYGDINAKMSAFRESRKRWSIYSDEYSNHFMMSELSQSGPGVIAQHQMSEIALSELDKFKWHSAKVSEQIERRTNTYIPGGEIRIVAQMLNYRRGEQQEDKWADNIHCIYIKAADRWFYSDSFIEEVCNIIKKIPEMIRAGKNLSMRTQ